jgi:ribosomal-protein-alanine N-acetyltransferase
VAAEPTVPPAGLEIRPMVEGDLDSVLEIERASFANPWRTSHFLHELQNNPWAVNLVAEHAGALVGYACLWCIHDELKINNIAVRAEMRARGIGRWLLQWVLHEGLRRGCEIASLEVRPSNDVAVGLYRAHGFREIGRRPNYYGPGEDAILMTLELDRGRLGSIADAKPRGV